MRNDRQLFMVEDALIEGLSVEEVAATWRDMVELGLHAPPFPVFDVGLTGHSFSVVALNALNIRVRELRETERKLSSLGTLTSDLEKETEAMGIPSLIAKAKESASDERTRNFPVKMSYRVVGDEVEAASMHSDAVARFDPREFSPHPGRYIYFVRTTRESKAAKLGIGKKKYAYTTTLSLGRVEEEEGREGEGTGFGGSKRPHLRRGHKRSQRYGPRNAFVKEIMVPPVFVNGYAGALDERSHYNVIKARTAREERSDV
jgi:hypothetical protein